MEKRKTDRRVKYTKQALSDALIELMQDAPLNKITVKQICDLADVNRGTFYAHFNDQYDLMQQIEEKLISEIEEASYLHNSMFKEGDSNYEAVCCVLSKIQQNSYVCTTLLGKNGRTEFMRRVLTVAQKRCREEWCRRISPEEQDSVEYLFSFTVNGCIGVIKNWINGGMREPPQQIAKIVDTLTYHGVGAYVTEKK